MARRVFFSFHYLPDNWRASQVRNIGAIEGSPAASDNDWEAVKRGGDAAIQRWIAGQMAYRTCTVVLVGENTAGRKWINYEIAKAWNDGMGVVGVRIHGLKDVRSDQSAAGKNPFDHVTFGSGRLSSIVKLHDTPYKSSTYVYDHIASNISDWIEDAIALRKRHQ